MEEKSGPNSVPILEAEGRKNLENKRKIRKKLPAEREPRSWNMEIARDLRKGEKRKLKKKKREEEMKIWSRKTLEIAYTSQKEKPRVASFPTKTSDQRAGALKISLLSPRFRDLSFQKNPGFFQQRSFHFQRRSVLKSSPEPRGLSRKIEG